MQGLPGARSVVRYLLYLVLAVVFLDVVVLKHVLNLGYPRHYHEENVRRYPAPYVSFIGKPGVDGHNELGFPGPSFAESHPGDLKIAFFGGSTGYLGDPPIPTVLQAVLAELLDDAVFVANYSVTASNHRQHLHAIIEFLPRVKPDLVIFYGGYNETIQSAFYDPRPGYPYNFFYRAETRAFWKLLLENSAIVGELDKALGVVSGIGKLRKEQQPLSDDWNRRIVDNYFETLRLAHDVAGTIDSNRFGKTRFLAFYQPYQVPEQFADAHAEIRARLRATDYTFDVSTEYDALGKVYRDLVHVSQEAREQMAARIASIVARELGRPRPGQDSDRGVRPAEFGDL